MKGKENKGTFSASPLWVPSVAEGEGDGQLTTEAKVGQEEASGSDGVEGALYVEEDSGL